MNAMSEQAQLRLVESPASAGADGPSAGLIAPASPDYVIETERLCLHYGRKRALHELSLKVPRGHIHAIVGANGAGKSSLFRVLLGFQSPSSGSARVLGVAPEALTPAHRAHIGYVNEEHTLPDWLRVADAVAMQQRQYRGWDEARYREVVGNFHIDPGQRISELSRGERAGLSLAMALAQSPDLLILYEPTLGLDVVAKRAFLEALMFCNLQGDCTIVYCSHQMEEIERVADNLIILERGELKHMSAPDDFCERVQLWVADIPFAAPSQLRELPGLLQLQKIDGLTHCLVFEQGDDFGDRLAALGARSARQMPVGLDRAVNAFLSRNHAAPQR